MVEMKDKYDFSCQYSEIFVPPLKEDCNSELKMDIPSQRKISLSIMINILDFNVNVQEIDAKIEEF